VRKNGVFTGEIKTMTDFKENRVKVYEIREGNVVLEVYKKINPINNKVYFDYRTSREFFIADNESKKTPYCQQRDPRDNIIALCKMMEWISDQHKKIKTEN